MKARRGRGEGSVFRRQRTLPSGNVVSEWVTVVSLGYAPDGKRIRRAFYGRTKAEALFKVEKLRGAHGGKVPPINELTSKEYLEGWLRSVGTSRSPQTHHAYERRLRLYFFPSLGRTRLDELNGPKIQRLYDNLAMQRVSADNIGKLHKALRRAFNVAVAQNLIVRNPVAHVARPQHRVAKRPAMDAEQVARFLAAAKNTRLEAMWRLAILATMRPGELFALRYEDLELDRALVDVRHTLADDKGRLFLAPAKADSARRIPLEPQTVALLRRHSKAMQAEGHGSPFVFVTESGSWLRGGPMNRKLLAPIFERAGLPVMTFYSLRHTGVSLFGEAGVHLRVAADLAGHSTTTLTSNVYTHAGEAQHRNAVEKIAKLIRQSA